MELALICLLSGAMGYSLLSLAVQVVDRSVDQTLTTQLSQNGKELIQLRSTGFSVVDAATGVELGQLRFVSTWKNAFTPSTLRRSFSANLQRPLERNRKRIDIKITPDAGIVVARLFDRELIWWNRKTGEHRVIAMPRTKFLDVTIREQQDRFYVQSAAIPDDPFTKATAEEIAKRNAPYEFNAIRDIQVFELSSGKKISEIAALEVGQPVQNRPDLRVEARGNKLEILNWSHFPEGKAGVDKSIELDETAHKNLMATLPNAIRVDGGDIVFDQRMQNDIDMSRFSMRGVKTEDTHQEVLQTIRIAAEAKSKESSIRRLSRGSVQMIGMNHDLLELEQTQDTKQQDYGRLSIYQNGSLRLKVDLLSPSKKSLPWSAARISESRMRFVRDDGMAFEFDSSEPQDIRAWSLLLPPYSLFPVNVLYPLVAVMLCWCVYAMKSRVLVARQGWLILFIAAVWPVLLWGVERGFTEGPFRTRFAAFTLGLAFFMLSICFSVMFLRGARIKAALLLPWLLLILLACGEAIETDMPRPRTIGSFFSLRTS